MDELTKTYVATQYPAHDNMNVCLAFSMSLPLKWNVEYDLDIDKLMSIILRE